MVPTSQLAKTQQTAADARQRAVDDAQDRTLDGMDTIDIVARVLEILKPSETVLDAIRRLGTGSTSKVDPCFALSFIKNNESVNALVCPFQSLLL